MLFSVGFGFFLVHSMKRVNVCCVCFSLQMGGQRLEVSQQQRLPAGAEASEQNKHPPTQVREVVFDWSHETTSHVLSDICHVPSVFDAACQGGMVQWLV